MSAGGSDSDLRRKPIQARSAARVDAILDRYAELVSANGYDEVSTTMLAQSLGMSVGSIYQFFPDKRAIARLLMRRELDNFVAAAEDFLSDAGIENWWDAVNRLFRAYVEMYRRNSAVQPLRFGDTVDPRLIDGVHHNKVAIALRLSQLLQHRFGIHNPDLALILQVGVESASASLQAAFRDDPSGDPHILAEAEVMLRGYLVTRLDPTYDESSG